MAQPSKPFLTCHVLDTTRGKPGAGINVVLTLLPSSTSTTSSSEKEEEEVEWTGTTNSDGRVASWTPLNSSRELNDIIASSRSANGQGEGTLQFELKFNTGAYFNDDEGTIWPEIILRVAAKLSEAHYHVPVLLGRWSFTTYRGS